MSLLKGKVNIYLYIREESFPSSNFMRQNQTISPYNRVFIASFGHCYTGYMQSLGHHWTGELYSSMTDTSGGRVRPSDVVSDGRSWDVGRRTIYDSTTQAAICIDAATSIASAFFLPSAFLVFFPRRQRDLKIVLGWLGNCLNTVYVWIGGNETRNFYVSFIVCLRTISILLMLSLLSSKVVARRRVHSSLRVDKVCFWIFL